jgi:nitrogen regulatory protein P-II 1
MKKIEMIIRPDRAELVKAVLDEVGAGGVTVTSVMGYGAQKGSHDKYRGSEVPNNLLHKIKIEVVVKDDMVDDLVEKACAAIKTGSVGDGKMFIIPIDDAVRVRTGERGDGVL